MQVRKSKLLKFFILLEGEEFLIIQRKKGFQNAKRAADCLSYLDNEKVVCEQQESSEISDSVEDGKVETTVTNLINMVNRNQE